MPRKYKDESLELVMIRGNIKFALPCNTSIIVVEGASYPEK
jgi:hypothetical protein